MKYDQILKEATLLKRYKRFLADVSLDDGNTLTIYCPNTGSMMNCNVLGSRVWYSEIQDSGRKYPHTWELVEVDGGHLVGIHTGRSNHLVREAIESGVIKELQGYDSIRGEVRYGNQNSRIDFLLEKNDERCYVEVKNVTLGEADGKGYFPDAVTTRGAKHLQELMDMIQEGHRAVLCYCVQHTGIKEVRPAVHIDKDYTQLLQEAHKKGLEILAYSAHITPQEVTLQKAIPVVI